MAHGKRCPALQTTTCYFKTPDPKVVIPEFVKLHPQYLAPNNSMEFISDDGGSKYNGCHCGGLLCLGNIGIFS